MPTRFIVILIVTSVLAAGPAATRAFAGQQSVDLALQAGQAKPDQGTGTQKPAPQTTKPKPKPVPKLPIGLRVFGAVESQMMAASSTFEAQGGSSSVLGYGVGGEVLNIWRKVFLRAGFSTGSVEGTRGFVIDGDFVSNGVPLKLGVKNLELAAGWRGYLNPRSALYFAAGFNQGTNSQESPDADPGDNDSQSGSGYVALVGFEFALQGKAKNPFIVGVEGAFRSVGGVLGESGGSEGFNENDLGGYSIRAVFGIRFKK